MMTRAEYIESLRRLNLKVYFMGELIENPVDHPMGGGEGRTSGGGHPVSPWGQLSKGYPTRRKSKPSNSMILLRRNGKKAKK